MREVCFPATKKKKILLVMQDVDYQFFAGSVLEEMLSGMKKNGTHGKKQKRF